MTNESAPAKKSESAFRTISEVAEDLNVQQHVLRFWETKFGQIKPLKRGGGRRYYRPEDVALLKKIHSLLYVEGYTIKGVQKLLKGVSKSQVLEQQQKGESQTSQAFGKNLPQVQGPDSQRQGGAALEFDEEADVSVSNGGETSADLDAAQRAVLQGVLNELLDMREQLRAVTGEKSRQGNAA